MARFHINAGETRKIESDAGKYIIITSWLIDTDGVNDVTLKLEDAAGNPVTATGGFTLKGACNGGGVVDIHMEDGRCVPPVTVSLVGAGSTAKIGYYESL